MRFDRCGFGILDPQEHTAMSRVKQAARDVLERVLEGHRCRVIGAGHVRPRPAGQHGRSSEVAQRTAMRFLGDPLGCGPAGRRRHGCTDYSGIDGPLKDTLKNISSGCLHGSSRVLLRMRIPKPHDRIASRAGLRDPRRNGQNHPRRRIDGSRGLARSVDTGKWHDRGAWAEGPICCGIAHQINYLPANDNGTGATDGREIFSDHPGARRSSCATTRSIF